MYHTFADQNHKDMSRVFFLLILLFNSVVLFSQVVSNPPDCIEFKYDAQGNRTHVIYHSVCQGDLMELKNNAQEELIATLDDESNYPFDSLQSNILSRSTATKNQIEAKQQQFAGQIQVYPNPASTFLNLLCTEGGFEYEIQDLNGKVILRGKSPSGRVSIDISFLSAGIYQVKILNEENYKLYKVIVK